jgi:hypothetical protein
MRLDAHIIYKMQILTIIFIEQLMKFFNYIVFFLLSLSFCGKNFAFVVGVGTHLGQGTHSFSDVRLGSATLGATAIRDDIYWDKYEDNSGSFLDKGIPSQLLDFTVDATTDLKNNSVLVLAYGHPRYDDGGRPVSQVAVEGYARYAAKVAKSHGRDIGHLQIWNEWNLTTGRGMKTPGQADDYIRLAKVSIASIRETGYKGKILIGGVGGDWPDWNFTKIVAASGLLSIADGYSVNLYNFAKSSSPDEMISRLLRLQVILSAVNGGMPYPVYVTETGWPTANLKVGSTEIVAAERTSSFLLKVRQFEWVKGVWVYELFDSVHPKDDIERSFGIFKTIYKPKAGLCILKQAITVVNNQRLIGIGSLSEKISWVRYTDNISDYLYLIAMNEQKIRGPQDWFSKSTDLCKTSIDSEEVTEGPPTEVKIISGIRLMRVSNKTRGKENKLFSSSE